MSLKRFEKYILEEQTDEIKNLIRQNRDKLIMDFSKIPKDIQELLIENFSQYIDPLNRLASGIFNNISVLETGNDYKPVILGFINAEPFKEIREISSNDINKLITINGIVISTTSPHIHIREAAFICSKCKEINMISQEVGSDIMIPASCFSCDTKRGFILDEANSIWEDYQEIVIQENPEEVKSGVIPRTERGRITGGILVDICKTGDLVNIVGTLTPIPIKRGKSKIFGRILDINFIEVLSKDTYNIELSGDDEAKIYNIAEHPNIYKFLTDSIFPSIEGHDMVKLGIVLALFGGISRKKQDVTKRGDIHVMMIGDPSVGKTRLLEGVKSSAPRVTYTSGKSASGVGLTAAVVQDQLGWTLQAGALVLSDGGICCIDEIDKISNEDLEYLLQALSVQTISIDKATIHTTLNAKTTIIAAANPTFGRYDETKLLTENVSLSPVLLSRFDLIFIMKDSPNEEQDRAIAEKIFSIIEDDTPLLDIDSIKKYILFAKQIKPKLTKEAKKQILDFYLPLRAISATMPDTPIAIAPRQLEGIIRLTEASARATLSETATAEHAKLAIHLLTQSLKEWGYNPETGKADTLIAERGTTTTKAGRQRVVEDILRKAIRVLNFDEIHKMIDPSVTEAELLQTLYSLKAYQPEQNWWTHPDKAYLGQKTYKNKIDNYT